MYIFIIIKDLYIMFILLCKGIKHSPSIEGSECSPCADDSPVQRSSSMNDKYQILCQENRKLESARMTQDAVIRQLQQCLEQFGEDLPVSNEEKGRLIVSHVVQYSSFSGIKLQNIIFGYTTCIWFLCVHTQSDNIIVIPLLIQISELQTALFNTQDKLTQALSEKTELQSDLESTKREKSIIDMKLSEEKVPACTCTCIFNCIALQENKLYVHVLYCTYIRLHLLYNII